MLGRDCTLCSVEEIEVLDKRLEDGCIMDGVGNTAGAKDESTAGACDVDETVVGEEDVEAWLVTKKGDTIGTPDIVSKVTEI